MRIILITTISFAVAAAAAPDSSYGQSTVSLPTLGERRPPLRELETEQTVHVTDFGARPDDSDNDLPAVRKAVEMVRKAAVPTRIVFEPGRYIFDADVDNDLIARALKTSVALYKMQDVVLDGNGAEITIAKPRLGFVNVLACTNVIVKNFTVDWDPMPFAQGFIRDVNTEQGTFTFEPEEGYLSLDHPNWQLPPAQRIGPGRWGVILDRKVPGRLKDNALNVVMYEGWEKNTDGTYSIAVKYRGVLKDMAPGDRYVQVDRNGAGLVLMRKSRRVTCMNLTNYTSPGLDYGGGDCSEVAILNCKVLLKPGRWHTSNADALHFQRHRIGPWIEGCTFEGMTDDGANLYTLPATCMEVLSARRFRVSRQDGWQAGDRLIAFNPREGRRIAETTVVSVEIDRETKTTILATSSDITGLETGDDKTADCFFNLDMNNSGFVIRNNTFRNIRRFGVLIQSRDGIVENNRFESTSSNAIMVRNSVDWPEGFPTGNLIIRGNTFTGCGFDHTMQTTDAAVIAIVLKRLGGKLAECRALDRILVEDNTIVDWRRRGILLACAQNATIRNNRLLTGTEPLPAFRNMPLAPIQIANVRNVEVTDNLIRDVRNIARPAVGQEDSCEAVSLRANTVQQQASRTER